MFIVLADSTRVAKFPFGPVEDVPCKLVGTGNPRIGPISRGAFLDSGFSVKRTKVSTPESAISAEAICLPRPGRSLVRMLTPANRDGAGG